MNSSRLASSSKQKKMIKLAIVEENNKVRSSISSVAGLHGFSCTQSYSTAREAITFLPKNPPDVVLVDINLPHSSGIFAIKTLKQLLPNVELCIFSRHEDSQNIYESLKVGATGYILKETSLDEIFASLKILHLGGTQISPTLARKLIEQFRSKPQQNTDTKMKNLTSREMELLQLLNTGLYYKEIAKLLEISLSTVKQHFHNIYNKLGVKNKVEAINIFRSIQ